MVRHVVVVGRESDRTTLPRSRAPCKVHLAALGGVPRARPDADVDKTSQSHRHDSVVRRRRLPGVTLGGVVQRRALPSVTFGSVVRKVGKPAPRVYRARRGRVSGEIAIVVPSAGDRAGYEHPYRLDDGKTWLPFPQPFTNETAVTLSGLRPGSTVWLRYRWTVKGVTGDWSQTISIMVD